MQAEVLETIGRYEIIGDLGAGSMSRVYLAHDPNLDRKVALKVVLQGFSLDDHEQSELERRFLLEARAAGKLSHPGIVRVYDADTDVLLGIPYIAMEWVQGRSLRSLIDEAGRLTPWRTLAILSQVARALDYAHRAGRIHRDIKPSNILIEADGTAKVSDFGVAKIVSETHTVSGQVLGTPAYMSPEQVKDDPLDGRSDLFSLGAVLYQCLAGATPFAGESLVQVVYKILNVDPRPLQLSGSPVLGQLSLVVDRSLDKDPGRRFQSGAEFAEALEAIQAGLGSEEEPETGSPNWQSKQESSTADERTEGGSRAATLVRPTRTRTVGLDTAAVRPAASHPDPHRTRATARASPADLPPTRARLPFVAALALAISALGVSAIFRLGPGSPVSIPPFLRTEPAFSISGIEPSLDLDTLHLSPPEEQVTTTAAGPTGMVTALPREPMRETPAPSRSIDDSRSEPLADQIPAPTPARAEVESPQSASETMTLTPVTILYRHKGGRAVLSVRLDGVRVWSQELKPVAGRLQRLSGYESRAIVPVPPGSHDLEISLHDPDRGIKTSSSIRSRYTNGVRRTLRVVAEPKENALQLRWKE